jgi:hypothetical protein
MIMLLELSASSVAAGKMDWNEIGSWLVSICAQERAEIAERGDSATIARMIALGLFCSSRVSSLVSPPNFSP